MSRQEELEGRASQLIQQLVGEFKDLGEGARWAVTRALLHRAVHFAVEQPGVEFCSLATYLGEMVGHAHKLAHGENPSAPGHRDFVH